MIITKAEEQPLFQRRIIEAIAEGKTPREEARQEIAKQLNKQEELIFVKRIKQEYGMQKSKIEAFVYENAEAASKFEKKKEKKEKKEEVKEAEEKAQKPEKQEQKQKEKTK